MISQKYVLFTRIPLTQNSSGRLFTDPLWAKDLKLHLIYIDNFSLCCPVIKDNDTKGLIDISEFRLCRIFHLKMDLGIFSVLLNMIPNFITVIQACRYSEISHSGGAGWAFPLSFYLLLLRPVVRFKWVIVIESSFWMLSTGEKLTLRKIITHYVHKLILKQCVRVAEARIFTQSFYRQYFLGNETERALVAPATWIDSDVIEKPAAVLVRYQSRTSGPLRIIFPTRLVPDKGVHVVLSAIRELDGRGIPLCLTIMGIGPLQSECQEFSTENFKHAAVNFCTPVEYGEKFFITLREYDFVLLANLKEEQPRIVFDAFSQGVGVIASCTSGIMDITNPDNAITFKPGSVSGLVDVITYLNDNRHKAVLMGLAGLEYVAGKTHSQMHIDRLRFFEKTL